MAIEKSGRNITTLAEWEIHAGPKRTDQWVDGRSAKEVARAWLQDGSHKLPFEVAQALTEHSLFGPVESWTAEPEARLPFDNFSGEPRNSDLVVHAKDSHGPYLIAVEAKADEPFGETIAEALASALERLLVNERSKGVIRIQQLAQALIGARVEGDPAVLLTACAGAICEAERRGYSRALLLIQEFVTKKTDDDRHAANSVALGTFVKRLSHGATAEIRSGSIYGPFSVPGTPLFEGTAELFIGKVTRDIRGKIPLGR